MNNKKFIFNVFVYFILIIIFFGIINFILYKVPQETIWIDKCFEKKESYAKSILDKKIVFTAGSNTLYGIETNMIEKELNIPVVNMAIHAGLKTDYILYKVKQVLKSGDIVIIPFEYENFTWDGENIEIRRDYILTHDKKFFMEELNLKEKLLMLYSVKTSDLINSIKEQFSVSKEPEIGVGYTSITLNKNGDETFKEITKEKILNQKIVPFKLPNNIRYETYALTKIKNFALWCKDNNITFYITFPNTIDIINYHSGVYTEYFDFLLNYFRVNNIKVIGEPTDSLYPRDYFYDTNYHMNSKGSKIRTYKFLDFLKKE